MAKKIAELSDTELLEHYRSFASTQVGISNYLHNRDIKTPEQIERLERDISAHEQILTEFYAEIEERKLIDQILPK